MSKKMSEFDRYDRMKRLEREAEAEKRKTEDGFRKKGGRPKGAFGSSGKNKSRSLLFMDEEDYDDMY